MICSISSYIQCMQYAIGGWKRQINVHWEKQKIMLKIKMTVLQNHEIHHQNHCVLTRVGVGHSSRLRSSALPSEQCHLGSATVCFAQGHHML